VNIGDLESEIQTRLPLEIVGQTTRRQDLRLGDVEASSSNAPKSNLASVNHHAAQPRSRPAARIKQADGAPAFGPKLH